jgi:hypothetical protein
VIYQVLDHNIGWTCPKCKYIWSPIVQKCINCSPRPTSIPIITTVSGPECVVTTTDEVQLLQEGHSEK